MPNRFPEVCAISPKNGPGTPERVRERYCYSVFTYSYHTQVTGRRQLTVVDGIYTPFESESKPEAE